MLKIYETKRFGIISIFASLRTTGLIPSKPGANFSGFPKEYVGIIKNSRGEIAIGNDKHLDIRFFDTITDTVIM